MAKKNNSNLPLVISLSYLAIALLCLFFFQPIFAASVTSPIGFWFVIAFMLLVEFPMSLLVAISGLGGMLPKDYYQITYSLASF